MVELPACVAPPGTSPAAPADDAAAGRPRRHAAGSGRAPAARAPAGAGRRRDEAPLVLVIEDNLDMNRFVCDALSGSFRVPCRL